MVIRKLLVSSCMLLCLLSVAPGQDAPAPGIMDLQKTGKNGAIFALQYDLVWMRLNPAILDDTSVMRYFIALNNCDNRMILKQMDSEFDYPNLASFYKAKAVEILNQVPLEIQFTGAAYLGDYDTSRKAFPLSDSSGKRLLPLTISGLSMSPDHGPLNNTCGNALTVLYHNVGSGNLLNNVTYLVTVPPATYTALAVDEGAARQYVVGRGVGSAGAGRPVRINLDLAISNQTPMYSPRSPKGDRPQVRFQGRVSKITVVGGFPLAPIGTLVP